MGGVEAVGVLSTNKIRVRRMRRWPGRTSPGKSITEPSRAKSTFFIPFPLEAQESSEGGEPLNLALQPQLGVLSLQRISMGSLSGTAC